ncbi:MAG TPA: hypothetical protein VHI74_02280 [Methyloceanibacter sp.]|jgi:hypothetical protein|nr:hypothetical protein [Methyloceanibacter sp.]
MNPRVTLRTALEDPELLGDVLGGETWHGWRSLLLAAMGEQLRPDELTTFRKFTGRAAPPSKRVDEFWCAIGRRGGKSRAMSALAIYLAALCDHKDKLVRGEKGVVLLLAPDMRQAKVSLDYAEGVLQSTPIMRQLLAARTADTLTLTNGISLEVRSASFRRIRGVTCVAVLADECAFWMSDDSANPDVEILNAARPALATTQGPLIAISSPYARRGALWETYKRHYGPDGDPAILVAQGATRDFNPELPQSIIDRAMERDAAAASAEYMAQFRTDVEAFITREAVEACTNLGVFERPPERKHSYIGFVDPSGGSSDAMTLAIAHTEGKTQILDVVRERKPPFSPEAVVEEYAALLRTYRCSKVYGDRYGGEWPREQFQKRHVHYEPAEKPKSELYRDLLPLINSGAVDLLESERLVIQLTSLERRTARGGKDSIDHVPGAHDDLANAVAGALVTAYKEPGISNFRRKIEYPQLGIV